MVHDGNRFEPENSGFLTDLGLPAGLDRLDAAFVWGKNDKTYFFRKNLYWKFDDQVTLQYKHFKTLNYNLIYNYFGAESNNGLYYLNVNNNHIYYQQNDNIISDHNKQLPL